MRAADFARGTRDSRGRGQRIRSCSAFPKPRSLTRFSRQPYDPHAKAPECLEACHLASIRHGSTQSQAAESLPVMSHQIALAGAYEQCKMSKCELAC